MPAHCHFGKLYVNGLFAKMAILCFSVVENNEYMKMEWLKNEMARRGLTQREVGEAIGMSDAQMSKVMSGFRQLKSTEADAIRRYLGYTLPDDEASELEIRLLRAMSKMTDTEKAALEVFLGKFSSHSG